MTIRWPCLFLVVLLACLVLPATARAEDEGHTEFNLREKDEIDMPGRGNLLNLVFGSAPPRASERGILLIDAFHDRNGDGRRSAGEEALNREIFCLVDNIEYNVPAFIPGLSYQGSYKILCGGNTFLPALSKEEVFVERRGQIFQLEIPCRLAAPRTSLLEH